ncbi:DUF1016 N-terminal domain-containing protein [Niastella yeongjuensis]|nr:DUF1016 N-terminal domain-containing protein [Niastella yeongjuensis]
MDNHKGMSPEDCLWTDLSAMIKEQYDGLITVTNWKLVTVFWDIGQELNQYHAKKEHAEYSEFFLRTLSTQLMTVYGPWFSENHIKNMSRFAAQFPRPSVIGSTTPVIIWEQIFGPAMILKKEKDAGLKNIFNEPWIASFRRLLEPAKGLRIEKKIDDIEKELLRGISQYIEKYRDEQNKWFSDNLNLFFLKIGERINQEQKPVIRHASLRLEKEYGSAFCENQLYAMGLFVQLFGHPLVIRIATLVTWEHIMILLPLPELEEKLFYVRLTATQGLSPAGLRKQIAGHVYENTNGAKEREQRTIAKLQNPTTETKVSKKGNNIFIAEYVHLEFEGVDKSLVVYNIFKNRYFMNFEKGASYF